MSDLPPSPEARPPPRDYAVAAAWVAVATGAALAGLALVHWARHHPAVAAPRAVAELAARPVPASMPVPVAGVRASRIADTFGAPRGRDRAHQGIDIFAPRGTPVLSATDGVVLSVREQGLGGRQVWVLGPARERHYYAHLDDWWAGLRAGDRLRAGMAIGTVGDTGNARGTPPHLHYGVYAQTGPIDPLPRLRAHPLGD
jgi:murein DD-endopeptidase MepM/ murein hydrolase activator NlpD